MTAIIKSIQPFNLAISDKIKIKQLEATIEKLKVEIWHLRQKAPFDKNKLDEMILAGNTPKMIALTIGCSITAVYRQREKLIKDGKLKPKEPTKKAVAKVYAETKSIATTAINLSLSRRYVEQLVNDLDLRNAEQDKTL